MNIETANAKLHRVKIRQKGERLYLRATLPNKDGSGKKQHELATGIPATDKGVKIALGKAQQLESDLVLEKFTWDNWQSQTESAPHTASNDTRIERIIQEFTESYWQSQQKTPGRAKCFDNDYGIAFRQLPADQELTPQILRETLVKTEPNTRARQRNHNAFTRLATFAKIEPPTDWKALKGKYVPAERYIPTEAEILETWERLSGPWQWAFAIFACYGLRNHEIARMTLEYPQIKIWRNTKTAERIVYPLHPDWPDRLNIKEINAPKLGSEVNLSNGGAVCKAFKRKEISFTPYGLRDAYAVRGAVLGVNPAVMSKWMGHSLSTHYKHYLKYIERADFDSVWNQLGKN